MSQHHVNEVVRLMNIGVSPAEHISESEMFGQYFLDIEKIRDLNECYSFDPNGSYCPISDVPDGYSVGVHFFEQKVYIIGDNSMPPYGCLFVIRLTMN